jgi:cyclopropane fatty-acyl-phospholipid synthase-like methyltransferase
MAGPRLYNTAYRLGRVPWEIGPRQEMVDLVSSGRIEPGRAVDLGCGTGANAIYLAQHGFQVTGLDFSRAALTKAEASAAAVGVQVRFVEDDLTAIRHDLGSFDFLLDYGTLDDLAPARRSRYVDNVVPLAGPGARFLLWCFQWPPRLFDRWLRFMPIAPGEIEHRFRATFDIEQVVASPTLHMRRLIPGSAAYLMTRRAA